MRPTIRPNRLITTLSLAVVAAGCGSTAPATPPASPRPLATAPASTALPGLASGPRDAWLVVGRPGEDDLRVRLASSGEELIGLPAGVPDATWGRLITVTPGLATSVIEDLVVQPGLPASRQLTFDGVWTLPTVGLDPMPAGVSADGSTIVLVDAGVSPDDATAGTTRFAIVDRSLGRSPRIVELGGVFDYDALSPDGSILYVAEHVPGPLEGRYQVRAVDTATGVMRDAIIVDKRNLDEQMAGWPLDQELRADGVVLTLYRGAEYPFIHALHSVEAWAVCIDLPARGMDDATAATDWGVVATGGGVDLAVNATLGIAVAIDAAALTIRGTVEFEPSAATGIRLAKFGHTDAGAVGRRVVADPNGSVIFAAGAYGIVRVGTDDLGVTGRFLTGDAVGALALTPDGRTLYALVRADGRIAAIDAATGDVLGWAAGDGFDRLVGVVPW
jgi:hypothetical protein